MLTDYKNSFTDRKYDTDLLTNLLMSTTVKEFYKLVNVHQSYEYRVAHFLWTTVYIEMSEHILKLFLYQIFFLSSFGI